ncbi:T9SS type A sorting domain-containing protein [bacterium]|nr:T9SS type A sorting domain-containing protein [bacterium]
MKKLFSIVPALFLMAGIVCAREVVLEGDLTVNRVLSADSTYLLRGFVRVKSGATLTIPAGTVLYGEYNTQGSLIVQPGGKLMAQGAVGHPIVFTSQYTRPGSAETPQRGDWGGIILLGKAPINVPGGTATIEGPGDLYGGADPNDNSGVLSYVRIEYAGIAFSPNNEINSLTFGGVGRGTQIDHIQVSYANDDSYEWFGGTVNAKYLIAYRGLDDDFDSDFGYQGKLQFLLGIRDPEIADISGSNGFESDNDGAGSTNEPRTSPTWWNVTLIGPKAAATASMNSNYKRGLHLRRSSQNKIYNALVLGWPAGLFIDGANTVADAQAGILCLHNSLFAGIDKNFQSSDASFQAAMDSWFLSNGGRTFTDPGAALLIDAFNLENPNAMPMEWSPVWQGGALPPDDGFFDPRAVFIGALGSEDWTAGWSTFRFSASQPSSVKPSSQSVRGFRLEQNYPNPFNPVTRIDFVLPHSDQVRMTVYNHTGQWVATLVDGILPTGHHRVQWDGAGMPSGLYYCRLQAGRLVSTRRMLLLK